MCVLVFGALRPLYAWLLRRFAADGQPSLMALAAILIGAFACAAITGWLGVHAVFGACLPRDDPLPKLLIERVEYLAIVVLMPIFFALAGLGTTGEAFVGAGVGAMGLILATAAGARMAGHGWRDSSA